MRSIKLTNTIWNKEELPEYLKESITVPVYKKGDKNFVVNLEAFLLCQIHTKFYPTLCCQG
jgi:hypothetical protein